MQSSSMAIRSRLEKEPDLPAIAGSYIGESVLLATAAAFTRIKFVSSLKKWRCPEAPEEVGSALIL